MVSFNVELPEMEAEKLKNLADERHTSPEELMAKAIMDMLARPDQELEEELDYLLKKHDELLRRLA